MSTGGSMRREEGSEGRAGKRRVNWAE